MKLDKKSMNREKRLKKLRYEQLTKSDIKFLEQQGPLNGIGAEWQGPIVRWILTRLFKFLKWRKHDFKFWKGGTIKDFHKANEALLEDSVQEIMDDYRAMHKKYNWSLHWRRPLFVIVSCMKFGLILYAFTVCDSKVGEKAFAFND